MVKIKMQAKYLPKVSIIIPVYNGSNYLSEAIDSALAQTYKNLEIIVVNDGSKDAGKTAKIAKSYGKKIRYFSKRNGGVSTALNFGIKKMRGQYFSWLSHDDLYKRDKIAKQVSQIKKYPPNTVLFCGYEMIDGQGQPLGRVDIGQKEAEELPLSLFYGCPVHGCGLLIPKTIFKTCGIFDPKRRTTQDYDMWFRILEKYSFTLIPEPLVISRIHPGQGTLSLTGLHLKESEQMYIEQLHKLSKTIDQQETFFHIADGLLPKFCLKASLVAVRLSKEARLKVRLVSRLKYLASFYYRLIMNLIVIKAVLVKRKLMIHN